MKVVLEGRRWESAIRDLLPREVATMLALALLAGGMQASFRTEELVTRTGLCRLTLRRALRALHAKGLITIKEVRSGTGGLTTVKLSSAWIEVKP